MNRRTFLTGLPFAPVAALPVAAAPSDKPITVTVHGNVFSRQSVDEMIRATNEAQLDGRLA